MWLWFGALPLPWLLGLPSSGLFLLNAAMPSIQMFAAMLVFATGMGLIARRALNY
jgi:hypothetical protein